jgi:hypothetical protein
MVLYGLFEAFTVWPNSTSDPRSGLAEAQGRAQSIDGSLPHVFSAVAIPVGIPIFEFI